MIKAKKSLGQNWLKDQVILQKIVASANLTSADLVLEIGPGQGALTEKLAASGAKVLAIELDDRLIPILQEKFKDQKNIEIIHDDILKLNLPELVTSHQLASSSTSRSGSPVTENSQYKIVANIPYYITAPIIRLLLETKYPPQEMWLLVQKEVAERICAEAGVMSILAVSVQYYATPEYLFTVPKESFEPVPKVDSAVVKITYNSQLITDNKKEATKKFFRIVKAGFAAKRKTLANNLASSLQLDKKAVEEKLESLGFSKNTRAQELRVEDWQKLVKM